MNMVRISTISFDGRRTSSASLSPRTCDIEQIYEALASAWYGQDRDVLAVATFEGKVLASHVVPADDMDDTELEEFVAKLTEALCSL